MMHGNIQKNAKASIELCAIQEEMADKAVQEKKLGEAADYYFRILKDPLNEAYKGYKSVINKLKQLADQKDPIALCYQAMREEQVADSLALLIQSEKEYYKQVSKGADTLQFPSAPEMWHIFVIEYAAQQDAALKKLYFYYKTLLYYNRQLFFMNKNDGKKCQEAVAQVVENFTKALALDPNITCFGKSLAEIEREAATFFMTDSNSLQISAKYFEDAANKGDAHALYVRGCRNYVQYRCHQISLDEVMVDYIEARKKSILNRWKS